MRSVRRWLTVLGCSLVLVTGVAGQPAPSPATAASAQPAPATPADQEMQTLLERLSKAGEALVRNVQSPEAWRYQIEQADILVQLAWRATGQERDNWLKMAIDSYYSAAVQAPENDTYCRQRLAQMPGQVTRYFPGNPLVAYAALREIEADYTRSLGKNNESPATAQELLRQRLLRFAQEYPRVPEAPKAVLQAAQLGETLGKTEDAGRCYRFVAENYPGQPVARLARGELRRLGGMDGQIIDLHLPLLYPTGERGEQLFDLKQLRGKTVLLYFWSAATAQTSQGFHALKQLTDRYQYRGLEVVFVNLCGDPVQARQALSGLLTAGTHVYDPKGLNGPLAEQCGLRDVPQIFLVGKDGALLRHSLKSSQLDAALVGHVAPRR